LKFKDEIEPITSFDNTMDEYANIVFKLTSLVSNIKKEIVGVLDYFLFSSKEYEETNS
jgi:hypothetical protein